MDYNAWFVVGDNSVSLYLLIPQYVYLGSLTFFYLFWHMFIQVIIIIIFCFESSYFVACVWIVLALWEVFVDFNCGRLLGISVGGGQEIDEGLGYPNRTEA